MNQRIEEERLVRVDAGPVTSRHSVEEVAEQVNRIERDYHVADTLDRLMAHHGSPAKAIVWAHNTHISDARATDMARECVLVCEPALYLDTWRANPLLL